jgi:alpha-glucoside transport system substrate-binding protein
MIRATQAHRAGRRGPVGAATSVKRGLVLMAVTVLAAVACAPGQSSSTTKGGTVHVIGTWGGSEQDSFLAMVKPFQDRTGIKVEYEGTRDINAVLTTRVQAGNPPELAGLPGPGQMFEFAKAGKLVAVDNILDLNQMKQDYSADWIKLGQYNGKTYSIFIKTAVKGLVWYDPKFFQAKNYQVPSTWDQMTSLSQQITSSGTTPWCIGLESGSASGWPGSDWHKEIVLSQSGPTVYDNWAAGKQRWTSPEVKQAFQTWGQNVLGANGANVYGGKQYMLATAFGDSAQPMFQSPPKCYMQNQGSFITDFFTKYPTNPKPIDDFKFFGLPTISSQASGSRVVAGDLFGMFKDTDQARQLLKYLTTAEAQSIWVKRGGAISPNKKVALSDYPDELSRSIGQIMVQTTTPKFDAGDLMPNAMQTAYWKGILDFVSDQSKLDSILASLDKVQADAYK